MLRLLMALPVAQPEIVRVLGVDDFGRRLAVGGRTTLWAGGLRGRHHGSAVPASAVHGGSFTFRHSPFCPLRSEAVKTPSPVRSRYGSQSIAKRPAR